MEYDGICVGVHEVLRVQAELDAIEIGIAANLLPKIRMPWAMLVQDLEKSGDRLSFVTHHDPPSPVSFLRSIALVRFYRLCSALECLESNS